MARSVEQTLAALRTLAPSDPKAATTLRAALEARRPRAGIGVAAAAKWIAELRTEPRDVRSAEPRVEQRAERRAEPSAEQLAEQFAEPSAEQRAEQLIDALLPALVEAYEDLLVDPVKRDPGCRGKIAIARALHALDHWEDRVFARGTRVRQLEGWGQPQEDTAAELRGVCGLAHAHFARPDMLDVLSRLLADDQRLARIAAAQAIGDTGRIDATAVLRYKLILDNDDQPEVIAACVESLFALDRDAAVDFALELLAGHDARAEAAALTLATQRTKAAAASLITWSDHCRPEQRHRVAYLALALLRADAANDHLLAVLRTGARPDALAAARALATFKDDPTIADLLRTAAHDTSDPAVRRELATLLEDAPGRR